MHAVVDGMRTGGVVLVHALLGKPLRHHIVQRLQSGVLMRKYTHITHHTPPITHHPSPIYHTSHCGPAVETGLGTEIRACTGSC